MRPRCCRSAYAKFDAALVQGATGGQHSRRLAKRCPHRQPTTRIHSPAAGPTRRARATPAVTEENAVNAHVLLRCYCAETNDGLRCDARSTRRAAGTRAPPQHTHTGRTARLCILRIRASSRNGAGVGGVASKHSESSRPCQRPHSEPGTIPPPSGFSVYYGEAGTPRGRVSSGATKGAAIVLARSRRPEAHQSRHGTAERRLCGAL